MVMMFDNPPSGPDTEQLPVDKVLTTAEYGAPSLENTELKPTDRDIAYLAAIVTSSNDAIISKTLKGIITSWNPGAERIFGYSAEEAIGQPITIIFPPDRIAEESVFLQKIAAGELVRNFDTVRLKKDGSAVPISVSLSPIKDKHGQIIGVSKIAQDITLRKQEEARLEQAEAVLNRYAQRLEILHKIDMGIIDGEPIHGVIERALKSVRVLIGCERAAVMLFDWPGAEWRVFADDSNRPYTIARETRYPIPDGWERGFEANPTRILNDLRLVEHPLPVYQQLIADGLLSGIQALFMDDGRAAGLLGLNAATPGYFTVEHQEVAAEIANQLAIAVRQLRLSEAQARLAAELEQKVTDRTRQLSALNQELDAFAYVVSHDLKAPLRGITQLATWLAADYSEAFNDEGRKMLKLLVTRAKRLHDMIEGILLYSRIGRLKETPTTVDLKSLVAEVIDSLAAPDGIKIMAAVDLPTVLADETRLRQVFQNLIGNAIKYMDGPVGQITITCVDKRPYWQFAIADTGPGIAAQYHEKVFQIFQTLSRRDDIEGTGIGLAVVKRIVEQYGGQIWLESTEGQGTIFYFTLPQALENVPL